jgi:hypothetical protein
MEIWGQILQTVRDIVFVLFSLCIGVVFVKCPPCIFVLWALEYNCAVIFPILLTWYRARSKQVPSSSSSSGRRHRTRAYRPPRLHPPSSSTQIRQSHDLCAARHQTTEPHQQHAKARAAARQIYKLWSPSRPPYRVSAPATAGTRPLLCQLCHQRMPSWSPSPPPTRSQACAPSFAGVGVPLPQRAVCTALGCPEPTGGAPDQLHPSSLVCTPFLLASVQTEFPL